LEETIRRADVDLVVIASPAKIEKVIRIDKPVVRVGWRLKVVEGPSVKELVDAFLEKAGVS